MKQFIILLVVFFNCSYLPAQWKPAGERIKTEWATKIDVENVLPEYPRPIMERPASAENDSSRPASAQSARPPCSPAC